MRSTDNLEAQPKPARPPDLWRAWERTADYVAYHIKQEAVLGLAWNSRGVDAPWMAQFVWAGHLERVTRRASAGQALLDLWQQIDATAKIFQNAAEARRAPQGYPPDQWFTATEAALLEQLIALPGDYHQPTATLLILYHALAEPDSRLQARLLGHEAALTISAQGVTLQEACQALYTLAAQRLAESAPQ